MSEGRRAASSTPGSPPQAPQESSPGESQGRAGLAGPPEKVRGDTWAGHHRPALVGTGPSAEGGGAQQDRFFSSFQGKRANIKSFSYRVSAGKAEREDSAQFYSLQSIAEVPAAASLRCGVSPAGWAEALSGMA